MTTPAPATGEAAAPKSKKKLMPVILRPEISSTCNAQGA